MSSDECPRRLHDDEPVLITLGVLLTARDAASALRMLVARDNLNPAEKRAVSKIVGHLTERHDLRSREPRNISLLS